MTGQPLNEGDFGLSRSTVVESLARHHDGEPIALYDARENACRNISRDEILSRGAAIARHLCETGVQPGDRVLTLLPTCAEFLYTLIGTWMAGAVIVPIVHTVQAKRATLWKNTLREIVNAANPSIVIGTEKSMEVFKSACPGYSGGSAFTATDLVEKAVRKYRSPDAPFNADGNAIAHIQFTSGSTGTPKGVLIRHSQIVANLRATARILELNGEDRGLSWLPIHHDMGFIGGLLGPLYWNIPQVLVPTESFIRNPAIWLQLVSEHGITLGAAPPFALDLLTKRVSDKRLQGVDLSSWRYVLVGSEPVFIDKLDSFYERFRHYGLRREVLSPGYGMAEATLAVTAPGPEETPKAAWVSAEMFHDSRRIRFAGPGDQGAVAVTCVGKPLCNIEVGIFDEHDETLDDGHQGRIFIRGEAVTQGYLGAKEKIHNDDGWLDTGDLGFMIDGELYITGRSKDLIIRGGQNIHPHHIEQKIHSCEVAPSGRVAAFSHLNHREGREEIVVLVEHRSRSGENAVDLIGNIRSTLAVEMGVQVDRVELVPPGSIPLTTSGKLERNLCRELYLDGKLGQREQ